MEYGPIIDRARAPQHRHRLAGATGAGRVANPLCGDEVTVDVAVSDGRVAAVGFEAVGCAITIGAADMVATAVAGMPPAVVRGLGEAWLHELIAFAPPPGRRRCASLGLEALQAALAGDEPG